MTQKHICAQFYGHSFAHLRTENIFQTAKVFVFFSGVKIKVSLRQCLTKKEKTVGERVS